MQLELTDQSTTTFYNPNPMSVLVQNFDQHEKRMLTSILYALKQFQYKNPQYRHDGDITVQIEGIRHKIGNPNSADFLRAKEKLTSRAYISVSKDYEYFEGRPLFSEIIYDGRKGRTGTLTVTINRKLHDAWLNLSNGYTPQYLDKCLTIKGKYAPALYDFICKYDQPRDISWHDLRVYLDIKGDEYTDWQSFKRGVLMRSKQQIEKSTARKFNYKIVRGERTEDMHVKRIRIWGELNDELIPEADRPVVFEWIRNLGFDKHKQKDYIREYIYENYERFIHTVEEVANFPEYKGKNLAQHYENMAQKVMRRLKLG